MQIAANPSCQMQVEANGPRSSGCTTKDPKSIHRVAQEFESLLISQLMKSMKQGDLTEEEKGANDSVMQYAQESMARVLSQRGGLGIAKVVERALTQKDAVAPGTAVSSVK